MAYHLQRDQDPLIRKPLRQPLSVTHTTQIQLYAGARPEPNFTLRDESFGYLLVNRNQIVPVRTEAKLLLDALDGTNTLDKIQNSFGQSGLAFVAYLFNKGLVRLVQ